eukprot:CAMPEP_0172327118 /NCGR_PEP_ID=MMETSP1058-20130122/58678_1 /TAXON_ID=83371 /ORGANISM="Detonula confervacea, Strain CCMP 353" /LENGTH=69 /DNA_ID=CAMNT_0013044075 /DNA_START=359 /DNA_END=567 /DNA_ORIENTATION=+
MTYGNMCLADGGHIVRNGRCRRDDAEDNFDAAIDTKKDEEGFFPDERDDEEEESHDEDESASCQDSYEN